MTKKYEVLRGEDYFYKGLNKKKYIINICDTKSKIDDMIKIINFYIKNNDNSRYVGIDFEFNKVNDKQANLINCWVEDVEISLGKMNPEIGKYAYLSLERAKDALKNNDIDVLVTSPINKSAVQQNQKDFIGHTEYLEQNFEGDSLMMMISENMKIAFVTSHIPLSEVSGLLNEEKIVEILSSLSNTLLQDFGIPQHALEPEVYIFINRILNFFP